MLPVDPTNYITVGSLVGAAALPLYFHETKQKDEKIAIKLYIAMLYAGGATGALLGLLLAILFGMLTH